MFMKKFSRFVLLPMLLLCFFVPCRANAASSALRADKIAEDLAVLKSCMMMIISDQKDKDPSSDIGLWLVRTHRLALEDMINSYAEAPLFGQGIGSPYKLIITFRPANDGAQAAFVGFKVDGLTLSSEFINELKSDAGKWRLALCDRFGEELKPTKGKNKDEVLCMISM